MVTPTVDRCLPLYGGQFSPGEILSRLANSLGQTLGARWFRVWSLVLGLAGCYRKPYVPRVWSDLGVLGSAIADGRWGKNPG